MTSPPKNFQKATDPQQYNSQNLNWEKEGLADTPMRRFFGETLDPVLGDLTNKRVLDIGSGTGSMYELYIKHGATQILGIEPSTTNVAITKKFVPEMAVMETTLEAAHLSDDYDRIVAVMVFEHLADLDAAFKKIYVHLTPGGKLLTIVADKTYHSTPRLGYELALEPTPIPKEIIVSVKRPWGMMHDILRPVTHYIQSAQAIGLMPEQHTPLPPSESLMQSAPKYRPFGGQPMFHLLVFTRPS